MQAVAAHDDQGFVTGGLEGFVCSRVRRTAETSGQRASSYGTVIEAGRLPACLPAPSSRLFACVAYFACSATDVQWLEI